MQSRRWNKDNYQFKAVAIHGFNVRDAGAQTVDTLAPFLAENGFFVDTDEADYGWHGLIKVRFFYKKAVERIRAAISDADLIYCHSNGYNYLVKALKGLTRPSGKGKPVVVAISPAYDRKAPVPRNIKNLYVLHTTNDFWVKVAALLRFHPWGSMGAHGYCGPEDPRVTNMEESDVPGHSAWFEPMIRKFITEDNFETILKREGFKS